MQPRNLHMTLVFVGNATPGDVERMTAAARNVRMRPFTLRIDRCQFWNHNRILWAGGEAPAGLQQLSQDLRAALDGADVHFDHKAFVPHITLLRNARAPQSLPVIEPIEWTAREFVLLASERDEEGPVYREAADPLGP
jgi:2'-5' RNA ligase